MMNVQINCVPDFATRRKWIVCRAVDGTVWFYDAWMYDKEENAHAQSRRVGGFVVENTAWLKDCFKS